MNINMMKYRKLESIYYEDKEKYTKMYNERYNFETTYRIDFNVKGNKAFIVLCNEILELLSETHKMDKKLINIITKLPLEAITQYKINCLVDEIKVTNEIEGIHSTRKEIVDILEESEHRDKKDERFVGLVKKYFMFVTHKSNNIELNDCNDIRSLYDEIVLQEVISNDKDDMPDGQFFRANTVKVVDEYERIIHQGVQPEEKLINEMTKALSFMNDDKYISLIRISVFHYMFCYLHPFYNGNGRMARFISSLSLAKDFNELISYRLAHTIKKDKNAYYKLFKITNDEKNKGDLTHFTIGFMEIIKRSIIDLYETLREKHVKYYHYIKIVDLVKKDNRKGSEILKELILNELFSLPDDNGQIGISIKMLNHKLGYSESVIRKNIKIFEDEKIIQKFKSGREYKYSLNLDELDIYGERLG